MKLGAAIVVLVVSARAHAGVTVVLERDGYATDDGIEVPRFGGGDRVWTELVGCVRGHFAPFAVDIVDTKPTRGTYITAVIGGRASQFGYDDDTTAGVSPYREGEVLADAVVHVFSQSSGERNASSLCASTAHEIGHALGLDHTNYCGDIMSYYGDACGTREFLDVDMACGERTSRTCGDGGRSQNSFARLAAQVGLRAGAKAEEDDDEGDEEDDAEDENEAPTPDAGMFDPEPVVDEPELTQAEPMSVGDAPSDADEAEPSVPAASPEPARPAHDGPRCGRWTKHRPHAARYARWGWSRRR
ncbi:MAG: matrixin family metalloprotease [Kofleriaceae bacterium]|nr:matrixin family metalloprotease [Kofleriaceae bacterium]